MGNADHTSNIDPAVVTSLQDYLTEAKSGPELGGITGELYVDSIKIDVAASRGWGVAFTRTLPNGKTATQRIAGQDVTTPAATGAIQLLLKAA